MKLKELQNKRDELRNEWRAVREDKLDRKSEMLQQGHSVQVARKDKLYKSLRKEQRHLSRMIAHLEKKISKKISSRDK